MMRQAAMGYARCATVTRRASAMLSGKKCAARAVATSGTDLEWMKNRDPYCNVGESIAVKIGVNLHRQPNHPLHIIKTKIESYFDDFHQNHGAPKFTVFDDLDPVVTTYDCFDSMLVPKDHVSRKITDTYYVDQNRVLRAHTSAHEVATMKKGFTSFLVSGDVYRRDEIDASHYPVFHQMEGVRIFPELDAATPREEKVAHVKEELKKTLEGMAKELFGDVEMRWVEAYFPFTEPSLELEIFFNGDWLEVLGCGVLQQEIVRNAGLGENVGWAFGLGLERLAMVLFDIPDIRLFWSQDKRFISQFKDGEITKFKPYSKYPACFKDVSFWHDDKFHENNLCEVVRDIAGDMVEQVAVVDEFTHPKTQRTSKCYRITYRHMDRNLTNDEVDDIQEIVLLYGIAVLWNTKRREAVMAKKDKTSDSLTTMLEKPLGMLDFVEVFQGVMERLKEMQIPSMGGWSRMMNMDQNSLHMHDEDLITYHELKLPECDELVHELEPYSALLFGKHEAPDFPTVQQDEACKIMNDYFDQLSDRSSPDTSSPSRGSITRLGADRRCSAMVADYINRFQGTQMFSMFNLQAQDAQNESDEGDVDRDDSENDGHVDEEYHYEGN
ncbi:hypothetical protein JG687_00011193 [Phytophthora cactorum]|uniref:phenylalanine--tRNA ligase n=1 Tax=Phytophthora cactorum TaxID=29920 RepID=A0A8T1U748_9STRA|nr:hypothetical protein JG687_00011193 [Phytophthora cactorum]